MILSFLFLSHNCNSEVIEKLYVTISYLSLRTATAEIKLEKRDSVQIISVIASSKGIVSAIYNVDNKYISTCDLDFVPIYYEKEILQKDFQEKKIVQYKHDKSMAKTIDFINNTEISYPIERTTYDIFSLLFAVRDLIPFEYNSFFCLANYDVWNVNIKFIGNEVLEFKSGKFECQKYLAKFKKVLDNNIISRTDMLTNNLFNEKNNLIFWYSNDENHIPIKAKYVMFPFSLHWNLEEYWHK
ncbi:MAG: DUF3108 domain-containing protein [Candidatus Cloacimonetes bacterium]|nr:DUF3108 domain-containing protein [Candidatus Cloacimonadota bacterium]